MEVRETTLKGGVGLGLFACQVDEESEREGYQNRILQIEEGKQKKWRRKNVGLRIHVNEGGRKSNVVIKRQRILSARLVLMSVPA